MGNQSISLERRKMSANLSNVFWMGMILPVFIQVLEILLELQRFANVSDPLSCLAGGDVSSNLPTFGCRSSPRLQHSLGISSFNKQRQQHFAHLLSFAEAVKQQDISLPFSNLSTSPPLASSSVNTLIKDMATSSFPSGSAGKSDQGILRALDVPPLFASIDSLLLPQSPRVAAPTVKIYDAPIPDLLPVVNAQQALNEPVMFPVKDRCPAGISYTITSVADVEAVVARGEVWCLFSVGLVPDRMPLGMFSTRFLLFHTTKYWVPWGFNWFEKTQGKAIVETHCPGQGQVYFGGAGLGELFPLWGVSFLAGGGVSGELGFVPGEFEDGRGGLVVDFRLDPSLFCPYRPFHQTLPAPGGFPTFNPAGRVVSALTKSGFSTLPSSQHVDLARAVGREAGTGRVLYLVRSALQDNNRPDRGLQTFMWTVWNGSDRDVLREGGELKEGQTLGPTEAFEYEQKSVYLNYYARVLPGAPGY